MKKAIVLLIIGIILALGPMWGLLGSTGGMINSFNAMAGDSPAKAEQLAESISLSLWSTGIGVVLAPIGAVIMIIAILWMVKLRRIQSDEDLSEVETERNPA